MGTLEGSDKSPFEKVRRLEDSKPSLTEQERKKWRERLDAYRKFRESPVGRDALAVATFAMEECVRVLMVPIRDVMIQTKLPLDAVNEARAEARGRWNTWHEILNEPEMIVQYLERMQKEEAAAAAKRDLLVPAHAGKIVRP